jgi:tryptophan synthase beta chain
MVRDFQSVIGHETMVQMETETGTPDPDAIVACVGGGSNAMGIFYPYLERDVALIGVEAAGEGLDRRHAATLTLGQPGILHGAMSFLLQDEQGQVALAHSVSAGLDYPGVGPEHAYLKTTERVRYLTATDDEALDGVRLLSRTEGIIPALETAHAVAVLDRLGEEFGRQATVVLNCSGRGDKDMETIAEADHD